MWPPSSKRPSDEQLGAPTWRLLEPNEVILQTDEWLLSNMYWLKMVQGDIDIGRKVVQVGVWFRRKVSIPSILEGF